MAKGASSESPSGIIDGSGILAQVADVVEQEKRRERPLLLHQVWMTGKLQP
ncbi:MAG: hypothetical protein J7J03_05230 [Methanosarcinales archaeon]|nr:hypothetical protein [Methanosarcinales archaeon]